MHCQMIQLLSKETIHDEAAYARICPEFGIAFSSDFRYLEGSEVMDNWAGGLHYQRHPDASAYNQYDWFCPNKADPPNPNPSLFVEN